jgi:putative DNA primase/helicase
MNINIGPSLQGPSDGGRPPTSGDTFDWALFWFHLGLNVVPNSAKGKHPAVKWKDLQERRVTEPEIRRWRSKFEHGVGCITGAISDLVVIETDGPEGEALLDEFQRLHGPLPKTRMIRSGSGRGTHYHFKHPGYRVKTSANPEIQLDIKGDGGFVVLPPTMHKSGGRYERIGDMTELAPLPEGLLEFIEQKAAEAKGKKPAPRLNGSAPQSNGHADEFDEWDIKSSPPPFAQSEIARLASALGCIPSDDREVWRNVGFALKWLAAHGWPEDVCFEIWDAWSKTTNRDNYVTGDQRSQWNSFKSDGDVTIGTVFHMAQGNGWERGAPVPTWARGILEGLAQRFAASSNGEALSPSAAPSYVSWGPFKMSADGLHFEKTIGHGKTVRVFVFLPFEVLGMCRNPRSREWGILLRWQDFDRHVHEKRFPATLLHGDAAALCQTLADGGLQINRNQHKAVADYLCRACVSSRARLVYRTGWHEIDGGLVFVLPNDVVIGPHEGEKIILDGVATGPYASKGTLQEWKDSVGALSSGHPLAVLALSTALAGPLQHLTNGESGGIHLLGQSSTGKSSLQKAAASVWGRGDSDGFVRSWRATSNGLEGLAVSSSDTVLVLDELSQMSAYEAGQAIYMLANGVGKARASRDGSLRDPKSFRLCVLSSGEIDIEAKISEDRGKKVKAGQLVRMITVKADRGKGFGVFDHAGDDGDAGKLAQKLSDAAVGNYGTAGPAFVRSIVETGAENAGKCARNAIDAFVADHVPRGADGQIKRVAKRFGLIAAAGELACQLDIVPWQKGVARAAAIWAFKEWFKARGGNGPEEERMIIQQVRLYIGQYGKSRFEEIIPTTVPETGQRSQDNFCTSPNDRLSSIRAGWTRGLGPEQEWYILPEVWKEIFAGLDPIAAAKILAAKGMLRRGNDGKLQTVVRISERTLRVYALTSKILEGGDDG